MLHLPLEQTPNDIISSLCSFEYQSFNKLTIALTLAYPGGAPSFLNMAA